MARKLKKRDKALRKELEAPDEFQVKASRGLVFIQENRRTLLWVSLGIGALIAASLIFYYLHTRSRMEDGLLLTRASQIYAKPVGNTSVLPVPTKPSVDDSLPTFETKEQKLAIAQEEWQKVLEKSGPAGVSGYLGKASTLFDLEQYDQAEAAYREFLEKVPDSAESLFAVATEGLGYTLEAKGDLDGAIKVFENLANKDPKGFYADVGRFHVARIYESQGKTEEAISEYKALITEYAPNPLSGVQDDAKQHLRALGVEPPKPEPLPLEAPLP